MNPDFFKFLSAILECINSIKVLDDTMHANQQGSAALLAKLESLESFNYKLTNLSQSDPQKNPHCTVIIIHRCDNTKMVHW